MQPLVNRNLSTQRLAVLEATVDRGHTLIKTVTARDKPGTDGNKHTTYLTISSQHLQA